MSTELADVSKAVAEFDRVAAGLGALQKSYGGVVYEVSSTKGMAEAKAARLLIREPRYEIERVRTEAKAPLLALGKRLDAEAKRITAELLKIEEPISAQIQNEEARKERERQAKIDAEIKRVAEIQARIEQLRGNHTLTVNSGSTLIQEHIDNLTGFPVDDSFGEFIQSAKDAKAAGLFRLNELLIAAQTQETEQKRIAEERAELAKLRAEQERREAEDRARRVEEERVAKITREAEAEAQAEANRVERGRQAAEEKRLQNAREQLERDQAALREAQAAAAASPPASAPQPTSKKARSKDLGNGLTVQRGEDGHWMVIEHEGRSAAFNIENVLPSEGSIVRNTVMAWIDAAIDSKGQRAA